MGRRLNGSSPQLIGDKAGEIETINIVIAAAVAQSEGETE
jgi:hypothetical protein